MLGVGAISGMSRFFRYIQLGFTEIEIFEYIVFRGFIFKIFVLVGVVDFFELGELVDSSRILRYIVLGFKEILFIFQMDVSNIEVIFSWI